MRTQPRAAIAVTHVPALTAAVLSLIGGAACFAAGPPTVQIVVPNTTPPAIQVGAAPRAFQITVANDLPGDLPTVTSFTLNGAACTPATCGSFSAVTGTSGSGTYSMIYTPPASLAVAVGPTVTVSPSLSGPSFAGTASFVVYPAGIVVQTTAITGGLNVVLAGSAVRTVTYTTYNDIGNAGLTFTMTGNGYACQNLSMNSCGSLGTPQVSKSGTTTTTVITYTPPRSVPDEPYDRVRIQATSVADPTKFVSQNFVLTFVPPPPAFIGYAQQFDSVVTGGAPITVQFPFPDTTATKTASWTITANGVTCAAPTCGTLGTPTVTTNGDNVTSTVTYTPPAAVPTGPGQDFPTITVTATANAAVRYSFSFHIVDGSCGTGNEAALNGQYAFLLKGGGATTGYNAMIGSFTADGSGNITGGLEDINRTTGVLTGLTLTGSYSVGSDNRGCLTLANSNGGSATFRMALGTLSGATATQGAMTAFVDNTGQNPRLTGVLMQQNLTGLTAATLSGTYAFGYDGVDGDGLRFAAAGLITPDGAGNITNIALDYNDNGSAGTLAGLSGSYSLAAGAPGGRGTIQTMIPSAGGPLTANDVLYMVSATDFLIMSTDLVDQSHPLVGGEAKLQTGTFSPATLANGSGYVFWSAGIDPSNGASTATVGQAQFTTDTGVATVTADTNDYGVEIPEGSTQATFSVDASGRVTIAGLGSNPPVIYLVDSTQGFTIGMGGSAASGYVQQQTLSSFSTSTISGPFFFGGGAPTSEGSYDSGTITFSPDTAAGTIAGAVDSSRPNYTLFCQQDCGGGGLQPNNPIAGFPYTFSTAPAAPGQGCLGDVAAGPGCLGNLLGYIISPSKVVFLSTSTPDNTNGAEILIFQQ